MGFDFYYCGGFGTDVSLIAAGDDKLAVAMSL
jgi:hypothetical protein